MTKKLLLLLPLLLLTACGQQVVCPDQSKAILELVKERDIYRDATNKYIESSGDSIHERPLLCGVMTQHAFYQKFGYDYSMGATESNEMMEYCIDPVTKRPYNE